MNLIPHQEAAAYVGVKPRTLATWRAEARGPVFYRIGNRILYKTSDLDNWIDQFGYTSTQEVRDA